MCEGNCCGRPTHLGLNHFADCATMTSGPDYRIDCTCGVEDLAALERVKGLVDAIKNPFTRVIYEDIMKHLIETNEKLRRLK